MKKVITLFILFICCISNAWCQQQTTDNADTIMIKRVIKEYYKQKNLMPGSGMTTISHLHILSYRYTHSDSVYATVKTEGMKNKPVHYTNPPPAPFQEINEWLIYKDGEEWKGKLLGKKR